MNAGTGLISGTPAQSGTFNVSISAVNAGGTGSATLTIMVQTPFAEWQERYFTSAELSNPAVSGPSATPAGDGITNLMKFALGLNPNTNGTAGLPTVSMTEVGGSQFLTLTYTKSVAADDVTYTVEVSSDLQTWFAGSAYTATVSTSNDAGAATQTVVVRDLTPTGDAARRLIRLAVTIP